MPPTFSAGSASVNIVPDFANAQRAIGRWFAGLRDIDVQVQPNLDQTAFGRIQTQLASMPNQHIKIDIDKKTFAKDILEMTDFFVGSSLVFDKVAAKTFGPRSVLMTSAVGALTAITGAASSAAGALFLLPAGLAAAVVPAATLALGVQGLGDAFKALASGDIEKINEAMGELAPSARTFATSVYALKPAFDSMRLEVQQELFRGIGADVSTLGHNYLPMLGGALSAIAVDFNDMAQEILGVLNQRASINDFAAVIDNVRLAMDEVVVAGGPITQMLIDITTVGSTYLPRLSAGFYDAMLAAAAWVAEARKSGELNAIIDQGIAAIKQLGELLLQVGGFLVGVFKAAGDAGATLIQVLTEIFRGLNQIVSLPAGSDALRFFFESLATAAQTLLPGLLAVAQALITNVLPAMGGLVAAVAPLVGTLLVQLADLISKIGPLFYPAMANAIVAVLTALAPLIPIIAQIAQILLPILTDLLLRISPIITAVAEAFGEFALILAQELGPVLPLVVDAIIQILNAFLPLLPVILELVRAALPPLLEIFVALLPVLVQFTTTLLPVLVGLIERLTPVIESLGNFLASVLVPVLGFLADHINIVIVAMTAWAAISATMAVVNAVQMAGGIEGMIVKLAIWIGSLGIVTAATTVWTAVTWLAAAAMAALTSPIGIVIAIIAVLSAAIILLWQHNETFRDIVTAAWEFTKNAIVAAWENGIKPAWDALVAAAIFMWQNVLLPTWNAITAAWNALVTGIKALWDNVLHPTWDLLVAIAQAMAQTLMVLIFLPIAAAWLALVTGIEFAWNNILHPAWVAIEVAAHWLWENVLHPIWDAMMAYWTLLVNAFKFAWDTIYHPMLLAIEAAARFLWDNVLHPIWDAMGSVWDALMRGMRAVYDNVIAPMWGVITSAVQQVRDAFQVAVDGIGAAWERLKGITAAPVNFVVRTVLRDGLFTAWNNILNQLGISGFHIDLNAGWLQGIAGYAYGGAITDAQDVRDGGRVGGRFKGPRQDNVLARLNPDEFVIQQPIATKIRPFLTALNAGQAEAVQAAGGWYGYGPGLNGYAAGGNVQAAIDQAKFMNGKPYIWGGVGPTGADCSGFMSQLTNVLRGKSPYSRVGTTATFPWPGFSNGSGTPFTIGNTKNAFNSGVGHMAGSLDGHSVESGSGHGPMIDGKALNAFSALFNMHGFLSDITGSVAGADPTTSAPTWFETLWGSISGAKDWLFNQLGKLGDLTKQFGDAPFTQWITEMAKKLPGFMWDKIVDTVTSLFNSIVDVVIDPTATTNDAAGVKATVQQIFAAAGWGDGAQWAATDWIVQKESGWNPTAQNPTSTASGLFQFIDSTWAAYGNKLYPHMKSAPANEQGLAGRKYIGSRYGDPVSAKAFWVAHNYYDKGGWLPPGLTSVWNATGRPEPVLTANEHDSLLRWRSAEGRHRMMNEGGRSWIEGGVHFHGVDKRKSGEIMDELWHRIRVARRGGVYATSGVSMVG